jgi:hypothetical protein
MSDEIPGGLPTLAHPLLAMPTLDAESDEPGIYRPPYPAINLNWDAFSVSHLRWVGFKQTGQQTTAQESVFRHIVAWHELSHDELALMPFSLLKQREMFVLYNLIPKTFSGSEDQIPVPLRDDPDLARNALETEWAKHVHLHWRAGLVQEVFAVRSSLREARRARVISAGDLLKLTPEYKKAYMISMPEFPKVYNAFDFIARRIGETAATWMVYESFGTLNPSLAFIELIFGFCEIDPHVPGSEFVERPSDEHFQWTQKLPSEFFKKFSAEQASNLFAGVLDVLDPDESKYGKIGVSSYAEKIQRDFLAGAQRTTDDLEKLLLAPSPDTFVLTKYTDHIHPFCKADFSTWVVYEEVFYGNIILLIEAILQQLTTGMGLLCPFWMGDYNGYRCCGGRNRALLERVWKGTADSACELWKRQGCLEQRVGAH